MRKLILFTKISLIIILNKVKVNKRENSSEKIRINVTLLTKMIVILRQRKKYKWDIF